MAQDPDALVTRVGHALEVASRHALEPVVMSQALVDESVVRPEEIEQASVLADQTLEQEFGLPLHRVREVLVEVREEVGVGSDLVEILQPQPLRHEARTQRLGARVVQHAERLPLQFAGIRQPSLHGRGPEFFVRRKPPEEEREPRSQVDVLQCVRLSARDAFGLALQPQHEEGAREDRLEGQPHADIEPALLDAHLVERHQSVDLARFERATVGLAREFGQDAAGARPLLVERGGTAGEDALADRRLRHAGRVVRPADDDVLEVRQRRDPAAARAAAGVGPYVRPDEVFVRPLLALDEGRGDAVLSGPDEDRFRPDGREAAVIRPAAAPRVVEERDALAIDRDVEVLHAGVGAGGEDEREGVLAVGREGVLHDHPAARAEGGPLDVVPRVLRDVLRVLVRRVDRRSLPVPDRHAADLRRRVQIGVEERRGERLHIGDVVEVGAHLVVRKPLPRVDLEPQEVADRPLVFGAVEPLEGPSAGVRVQHRGAVHDVLERLDEFEQFVFRGTAHAGRRHHAGAQLADHLLRGLRLRVRDIDIEGLEGEVARQPATVVAVGADPLDDVVRPRADPECRGVAEACRRANAGAVRGPREGHRRARGGRDGGRRGILGGETRRCREGQRQRRADDAGRHLCVRCVCGHLGPFFRAVH